MPAYNVECYIVEAINSVLNQTYENFELIVVDDGSTDSTLALIKKHFSYDRRIKVVTGPNSGHPAKARNKGLALVSGNLLTFLDADDLFYPTKLERQAVVFEKYEDVDICFHDVNEITKEGQELKNSYLEKVNFWQRAEHLFEIHENVALTNSSFYRFMSSEITSISTQNIMLRLSHFTTPVVFNERLKIGEDIDLWFKLALKARRICYLKSCLSAYRSRPDSITTDNIASHMGFISAHRINLERSKAYLTLEEHKKLRSKIESEYGHLIYELRKKRRWSKAVQQSLNYLLFAPNTQSLLELTKSVCSWKKK